MKKNGRQKQANRRTITKPDQEHQGTASRQKAAEGRFEQRERRAEEVFEARKDEERQQLHLVDRQAERLRLELDAIRAQEGSGDSEPHGAEVSAVLNTEIDRAVEKVRAITPRMQRMTQPRGKTITKIVFDMALEVQENLANLMRSVGLS